LSEGFWQHPKYILIKEAKRWGADSIFVGARGLSNFERLLLGSVSTAVATRAHCSVEVVRANVIEKPDGGTAVANP
jgi:nucleotide-binding universal stress UspA family protein